jgi:hypothetical protein
MVEPVVVETFFVDLLSPTTKAVNERWELMILFCTRNA